MLITMLIIAIILSAVGINMIRMQKEDEARRKRRKEVEKTLIRQRLNRMNQRLGKREYSERSESRNSTEGRC